MAELTTTKLNAESHLLLDQPLLRMPYELSRRNFKTAQRHIERDTANLVKELAATQAIAPTASADTTLSSLDSMISKMQGLKRKLEGLHEEEMRIHKSSKARLQHLQDLYEIQSLVDVKYDEWSRTRLSRLLVDYLLREGYSESAAHLAQSKNIEQLVDVDAFVACHKIERSLREGKRTSEALKWCQENGQGLKKVGNMLEFELRLQQYIELVRQGHEAGISDAGSLDDDGLNGVSLGGAGGEAKLVEARAHAKKYLSTSGDFELLGRAAGLLAYRPWDEVEPYASLYSSSRWNHLADLFVTTHHNLYSLPPRPLLHIALSAGLSALKTPSCHSEFLSSSANASSSTTTVCPICSTELNDLARNVPYAHHTKSIVESDPVVLPNGRIYGRERLRQFNEKVGTDKGCVRDPVAGINSETWSESDVRKVFIM
ncbi:hypothetical protein BS50DRAFT_570494 [Corynespora cassiicola Philippines]|uniref:Protein FYV10 n=1 Tax=Corynespora cassiicola Philippines TaxID=1448308 RepID=A0A2T2P072_CORCC|nr:hypothetical protein BS50DRAFT_570494 [Corynespora cassiicola Philippines]